MSENLKPCPLCVTLPWIETATTRPYNGQIVLVFGGTAEYRDGEFFTGMVEPKFTRRIEWNVSNWMPLSVLNHKNILQGIDSSKNR